MACSKTDQKMPRRGECFPADSAPASSASQVDGVNGLESTNSNVLVAQGNKLSGAGTVDLAPCIHDTYLNEGNRPRL